MRDPYNRMMLIRTSWRRAGQLKCGIVKLPIIAMQDKPCYDSCKRFQNRILLLDAVTASQRESWTARLDSPRTIHTP